MPPAYMNWHAMIRNIEEEEEKLEEGVPLANVTHYSFQDYYFWPESMSGNISARKGTDRDLLLKKTSVSEEIPPYMNMARRYLRSLKPARELWKSVVSTSRAKTLHSHGPTACLGSAGGACRSPRILSDRGILAHYRGTCQAELKKVCDWFTNQLVSDRSVLRYTRGLVPAVAKVVDLLGLVGSDDGEEG